MDAYALQQQFNAWVETFDKLTAKQKTEAVDAQTVARFNELVAVAAANFKPESGVSYPSAFPAKLNERPKYADFAAAAKQAANLIGEHIEPLGPTMG